MRYLILSDIHANWQALEAVLRHAEGAYDRILCCGDFVGYGADPNRVVDWAREHVALAVRGNHDKAAIGLSDIEWFNSTARAAALWTRSVLTPENTDWLTRLPKGPLPIDSFQILHGSPVDEDEYLVDLYEADEVKDYIETPISFFGHTHIQGGFLLHRNGVKRVPKPDLREEARAAEFEPDLLYLINPGSVGQPRDSDPRAAYALYDPAERFVTLRRTAYDVDAAQERILAAKLPGVLASRLALGR
ncbi:MAG: metallophosphoesterase family protein [Bryobacteraceae bacterium]